jgi:membrane-bound serine protease (ClpP class)
MRNGPLGVVTTLLVLLAGALAAVATAVPASAADTRPHVDVVEVNGLIDPVTADFLREAVANAEKEGATVLVVQLNSSGGVLDRASRDRLTSEIADSKVPVAVWVGPSGSKAEGQAFDLVRAAAVAGTSTRTRLGKAGTTDPLADRTITGAEALLQRVVTVDAPTLGDFVVGLDGQTLKNGSTLSVPSTVKTVAGRPPQRQPDVDVRLAKLGLLSRLLHTAASPSVAYLLLVIGLLLVLFEFFTAGVGVAAAVAALFLVLAAYGLEVLPARGWAVAILVIGLLGYAIDVQAGVPRFWTVTGTVLLVVGTVFLYHGVKLSWLAMAVGVAGTALMMVAGMPAVVRSRFSTPTIGRESMVGEMGKALADVDPEGTVEIRGAQWRARTNRATPIERGDRVRVVAIDGLLLEVEPETGGARDAGH